MYALPKLYVLGILFLIAASAAGFILIRKLSLYALTPYRFATGVGVRQH